MTGDIRPETSYFEKLQSSILNQLNTKGLI
jgi:hypothetical protein